MNTAAIYVARLVRSISLCIPACSTHIAFWLVYGQWSFYKKKGFLSFELNFNLRVNLYKHSLIYYNNKLIYIFVQ